VNRLFKAEGEALASGMGEEASTRAVQKRVDDALRRWRHSGVPVEDPHSVGDRRAKATTSIAAAMRQGRLERDQLKGRRRWVYVISAAGVLLGLSGAAALTGLVGGESASRAAALESQVTLTGKAGQIWVGSTSASELVKKTPLQLGARHALAIGDRIVTQGHAALDVGGDTQVQLRDRSELLLVKNAVDERRLKLSKGHINVAVTPQSYGAWQHHGSLLRAVVIETPDASVVVHGTRFSVVVDSGATRVAVAEGVVAVLQQGVEKARLRAGQTWTSAAKVARNAQSAPSPEPTSVDEPSEPSEQQPESAKHRPKGASGSRPRVVAASGKPAQVDSSPDTSAVEVEIASSTLKQENRLFRAAVDARNTGDDARAVRFFDQLLSKYPKSAVVQEARVERFRALRRLGRDREAAKAARRYLVEHGDGFAEDEARDVALTPGN
jgi:TolA-binding protein